MSTAFFIVGFCIFGLYVYFLIWSIFYNNKKQRQENRTDYYTRNLVDDVDMDGHGNYGRIPNKTGKYVHKRNNVSKRRPVV